MKNYAHLKQDSPFFGIFENGSAPIINCIVPSGVRLEGSDETEAYMLDVKKCSSDQIDRIADIISLKFRCDRNEVVAQIRDRGLPIRASQVESITTDVPAFL